MVCMLCTRLASLQRSTLLISNWKTFFFLIRGKNVTEGSGLVWMEMLECLDPVCSVSVGLCSRRT